MFPASVDILNSNNSLNSSQSQDNSLHDNLECSCLACSIAYHASRGPHTNLNVPPFIISMANYEIERERRMRSSRILSTFGNRTQIESITTDIPPSYGEIEELPPSYENYQHQFNIRGNNSWLENKIEIKTFVLQILINQKVCKPSSYQVSIKLQQILNQK